MNRLLLAASLLAGIPACAAPASNRPIAVTETSSASLSPPPSRPVIVVRAQTEAEAFDYLWLQLGQIEFFTAHHYQVGLPNHPFFQHLAVAGVAGADRDEARLVFATVYDPHAFDAGLRALRHALDRVGPALDAFAAWEHAWGFERRPRYEFTLTMYGPGGSYDPDTGVVTILTTADGAFRIEPLQGAVHEMIHMGIERPIARRLGLSHEEKERLVDLVCIRAFRDLLPAYQIQPMGPPELDAYIDRAALSDLPRAVQRYVSARRVPTGRTADPSR